MRMKPPPSQRAHGKRDPLEPLRTVVQMQVALGRQTGNPDTTIRERVLSAFKGAVEQDTETLQVHDVGDQPMETVSSAGMFRLALAQPGLDRKDQRSQETWLRIVQDELEKTLGRHDGDYERRVSITPK